MHQSGWKLVPVLAFSLLLLCASEVRAAAPTVSSLSPTSGAVGTAVTITGTNFGATQGTSTVNFNGTTAAATSWSNTSIVAAVPSGAVPQGYVSVTVAGLTSNGRSFQIGTPPTVSSLSPTSGAVGTAVTITGTNFGATQGTSTVNFNGTTAAATSWSNTGIVATVPSGAVPQGYVSVTVAGLTSNGQSFQIGTPPTVSSLSPTSGAVGTAVTITGTNFGATQGTSTVNFNGTTATATNWSDASIVVAVPSGAVPQGYVSVTVAGLTSNGRSFQIGTPPTVSSLSPTSGAVGTAVTITGTNFGATQGTSTVNFNGTTATATSWSATSIVVGVPSGAVPQGYVSVTVAGLTSNGLSFTVSAPANPSISSLSPFLEQVGISVTIAGTNFGSTRGSSSITFNGISATPTAWSNTSIVATVPTGATTGYVVVTVGGVASNQELFAIVPPLPAITSLSPTSGMAGTAVTISGSGFGTAQGASTVTFNGVSAVVTSWGGSAVVANVPSNATTGNIVVTAGGVGSNGAAFTVTGPTVSGLSAHLGAAGDSVTVYGADFGATQAGSTVTFNGITATPTSWSDMTIAVPVPAGATTGPITVVVAGVSSSSNTFTVSRPDTITGLSITGPSDGAIVSTPYAAVTGTVTGSIAGIDPIIVTCNNSSAKLTTTNFSCNPPLSAGVNSITVTGTDSAGDTQTATISVTLGMSPPISIQVTPPNANMLVGGAQSFTAVDDQGVRRPDATWTVSDSTIASFVSGSANTLMANAVGQVTLTATVGGVSAETTVTILSGTSLPVGTVLWSATPVAGYTPRQIVQAVPTADGPDLYSIEGDSNGDTVVRAFKSTGEQMWQSQVGGAPARFGQGVGDNFGGLLLIGTGQNNGTPFGVMMDLDRQSGGQSWQYTTSGYSSISFGAVGLDGSVYAVEEVQPDESDDYTYLDSINGASGGLQSRIQLPISTSYFHCPDETFTHFRGSGVGSPAVAPDGAFYGIVGTSENIAESNCEAGPEPFDVGTSSSTLSLMRVSPDGGVGFSSLDSTTKSGGFGGGEDVIPDGQGGVLATWFGSSNATVVADIGGPGGGQTIFSSFPNGISSMVLGDNNTAFATNGYTVVAFDATALQQKWSYTSTGGLLSFVVATSGGGVTINDSSQGVISLDSSGNPTAPLAMAQTATAFRPGWAISVDDDGTSTGSWIDFNAQQVSDSVGPYVPLANSVFPADGGGGTDNRRSSGTVLLDINGFYPPSSSNALTQGDALKYGVGQTCPPDPSNPTGPIVPGGPLNCVFVRTWPWNVEVVGTVSDDASKWTPRQTYREEYSGSYTDGTNVYALPNSNQPSPDNPASPDFPDGPTIYQNTRGTHKAFYLDEPGPHQYFHVNGVLQQVYSINAIQDFRIMLCNQVGCPARQDWFVNVIVNNGSVLDVTHSSANYGRKPLP